MIIYFIGKAIYDAKVLPTLVDELKAISFSREDFELVNKYQELPKIHYIKQK